MSAYIPEKPQRRCQAKPELGCLGIRRGCWPAEGRPDVSTFLLETLDPRGLTRAVQFSVTPLGERHDGHGVTTPYFGHRATGSEPPRCVLANGFQEAKPDIAVLVFVSRHQVLVHE